MDESDDNSNDCKPVFKDECRICEKSIGKNGFTFENNAGDTSKTYSEIISYLHNIDLNSNGKQDLCGHCSKALIASYVLTRKIEDREQILGGKKVQNNRLNNPKIIEVVKTKKDVDENEEINPLIENIKIEPDLLLEMEGSDKEGSYNDSLPDITPFSPGPDCPPTPAPAPPSASKHKKHKKSKENRHPVKKSSQSSFEKPSEQKIKAKRGDIIKCPLCDYQSDVRDNYQKHVLRRHNRQEMKCDGCDMKFHLIYLLNDHRRDEHDFTHEYEADESLKLKPDIKISSAEISGGTVIVKNEDKYGDGSKVERRFVCPLCPYVTNKRSRFGDHYRKVHDNLEFPCDGCSGKFHLFYSLLEHRQIEHRFTHDYVIEESIKQEDLARKEQRRLEKGQHFPCPECDRWFREKRFVAKHLKVVHKFVKYQLPKGKIKMEKIELKNENGEQSDSIMKKKYIYPTQKVICYFCGKLVSSSSVETHIRNMHPEERDPYICAYCDEKIKTKHLLISHMFHAHNFPVMKVNPNKKPPVPRAPKDQYTIKNSIGNTEYICRYCPEILPFKISRKRHEIQVHTFKYPWQCGLCDKPFVVKFEYKRHLQRHMEGKRLTSARCQACGQYFLSKKEMAKHPCAASQYGTPDNSNFSVEHTPAHYLQQLNSYR